MATVREMIKRFEMINSTLRKTFEIIIEDDNDIIIQLQRDQLWAGQGNDGNNLSPSYFDDPYFKTIEAAQKYSDWKDKITPGDSISGIYPDRKIGTPNLFINGYWQSGIRFDPKSGLFTNNNPLNPKISQKYPNALGINRIGCSYYVKNYLRPQVLSEFHIILKI